MQDKTTLRKIGRAGTALLCKGEREGQVKGREEEEEKLCRGREKKKNWVSNIMNDENKEDETASGREKKKRI